MNWRRWRRNATSAARAGMERAKRQLAVAEALEQSARELAADHRAIQQANHFGPNVAAAFREAPR